MSKFVVACGQLGVACFLAGFVALPIVGASMLWLSAVGCAILALYGLLLFLDFAGWLKS